MKVGSIAAGMALIIAAASPVQADELILPAPVLDRDTPVVAVWRPDQPAAGALLLEWTDSRGRLVARISREVDAASPEIALPLDLRRAVAPRNHLSARFVGEAGGGERASTADFLVRSGGPPGSDWDQYQVMMFQDQSQAALAALPALGVTATAIVRPLLQAGPEAVRKRLNAGLRFYTENLATDFYASYHRYMPGRTVAWRFDTARAAHLAVPDDPNVFVRWPSLSDPDWLATITARLEDVAWREAPYRPLFHDLGDEGGIADTAAAWDFDLSPASLSGMRTWLADRYGGLAQLNRAWGTAFATWEQVRPALTDAALRDDHNLPAWMDFKAWMDDAYARAVRAGAAAVHRGDQIALAGLEGAQVPGWGGYDYGRLAGAVDVMEIYDAGNAVEIAQSLNPALRVLTTVGVHDTAIRQLWHELLLGGRGAVLWDDAHELVTADGQPGSRSEALAPLLRSLTGALGAQILAAHPESAQVAILYSQASFRLQWLLDRRKQGGRWEDRDAEAEFNGDNAWRAATRRAAAALATLGVPARWITPEALPTLGTDGTKVLVLPDSLALADEDVAAVRRFAAGGGLVLADAAPGQRDALGRPRAAAPLADLAAGGALRFPAALTSDNAGLADLAGWLDTAGVARPIQCFTDSGEPARDLDIRLLRAGPIRLYAVQSLSGARQTAIRFDRTHTQWAWLVPGSGAYMQLVGLTVAEDAARKGQAVGLDAEQPLILAVSDEEPPHLAFSAPDHAAPGDLVTFHLKPARPGTGITLFAQVAVFDPAGYPVRLPVETLRVPPQGADWQLPLALNDPRGNWTLQFLNATLGDVVTATLEVK
jgi:hypothetical protein